MLIVGVMNKRENQRATAQPRLWITAIASALLLAVGSGCSSERKVASLLSEANLSPLPASATNVAYNEWNGLFGTGETYAKFQLSAADVRTFISNSPALQGITPKVYSTNHQHVPYPTSPSSELDSVNEYFFQHPKFPAWFNITIRSNGRKYVIPWGRDMCILIDEDRHIVWLRLVKG
jgi:hypothetical protein